MYLESNNINPPVARERITFSLSETLLEKGSGSSNDDALSTENGMYIVCDGATSLVGDKNGCSPLSGGQKAASITAEIFSKNCGSLAQMTEQANDMIRLAMHVADVDVATREHLWSTSFAAGRIVEGRLEWARAGDCMILLIYDDGRSRLVTEKTDQDVEVLKKWQLIGESVQGTIHQVLAEDIADVRRNMNRTYGVLNGEVEALDFVQYGSESLQSVSTVLLFSDGLNLPERFPQVGLDVEMLSSLYGEAGLMGVRNHIRDVQRSDPRCCMFPRFKMHDDISAIALTVNQSGSIP